MQVHAVTRQVAKGLGHERCQQAVTSRSTLDGAQDNRVSDYWVEHTVWVLPLLLLMGLGLFRKGLAL